MEAEKTRAKPTNPTRVLIADDHDLVRHGFHRMLAGNPELEVVGEARDGREAVELCRSLRPDLVLMDVRMPVMDGLQTTRAIKEELPETGVLVVTTYADPDYLSEAIRAGAAGYVLKDSRKRDLIEAIRGAINGEAALDSEVAMQLIKRFTNEPIGRRSGERRSGERRRGERRREQPTIRHERSGGSPPIPFEELTPREREVLALMAQGKSNPEIADALVISRATAKVHVRHVIAKLRTSDRTQAVVRALQLGLVGAEA